MNKFLDICEINIIYYEAFKILRLFIIQVDMLWIFWEMGCFAK
jgi:hypothetical protein